MTDLRQRLDPRARQGIALLVLVYAFGWTLGRAAGKVSVLERYAGTRGH